MQLRKTYYNPRRGSRFSNNPVPTWDNVILSGTLTVINPPLPSNQHWSAIAVNVAKTVKQVSREIREWLNDLGIFNDPPAM